MTKKPDIDSLICETIGNIRADRRKANELVDGLLKEFRKNKATALDKDIATSAGKYMEALARGNEQLVKLISLEKKTDKTNDEITDDDLEDAYGGDENA